MFGYITVCAPELKVKDYQRYKAYYCGLCHALRKRYGHLGQMTLTYDMTFLIIFLTSLYENESLLESSMLRCKAHPARKQTVMRSEITEYAADMNLILAYYHLQDDWKDEKKLLGFVGTCMLRRRVKRAIRRFPRQSRAIRKELKALAAYEKQNVLEPDLPAGCFGRLMEELFLYKKDKWEPYIRMMGFYLGKYIYLMDAYEDLEKDIREKNYNPLKALAEGEDYEERCRQMLCMMMGECTAGFEHLPCILDIDILRNILYDGVWKRYRALQERKEQADLPQAEGRRIEKSR